MSSIASVWTVLSRTLAMLAAMLCVSFTLGCSGPVMCILEGSQVATPRGDVPIESLRVGDQVITRVDGTETIGKVTWTKAAPSREHLEIALENASTLRVTDQHPIATPDGFIKAGKLTSGDTVLTRSGQSVIKSVSQRRAAATIYDLSIEPGNVFFAEGVLVHNKSFARPPLVKKFAGIWLGLGPNGFDQRLEIRPDGSFTLTHSGHTPPITWTGRFPVESLDGELYLFGLDSKFRIELEQTNPAEASRDTFKQATLTFEWPNRPWRMRVSGPLMFDLPRTFYDFAELQRLAQ
jgi:hypothetical protein